MRLEPAVLVGVVQLRREVRHTLRCMTAWSGNLWGERDVGVVPVEWVEVELGPLPLRVGGAR